MLKPIDKSKGRHTCILCGYGVNPDKLSYYCGRCETLIGLENLGHGKIVHPADCGGGRWIIKRKQNWRS
jgi:hypothetical protein